MKCPACKHIHEYNLETNKWEGKLFRRIINNAFAIERKNYWDEHEDVDLYVCPKCNCVIAEKRW